MATLAGGRLVLSQKRKLRFVVAERHRTPLCRRVAFGTRSAIPSLMRVIVRMTAVAITRQRRSDTLHMTRLTFCVRVLAGKRKACARVIERRDRPSPLIVA